MIPTSTRHRAARPALIGGGIVALALATLLGAAPAHAEGGSTDPSVAVSVPAAQPRATTPPPVTPPASTPPASTPPAATAAPATEPTIPETPGTGDPAVVDKEMYRAGGSVTVTASGFTPGEQVQLVLYSEPVLIGNFSADAAGAVSIAFTLPEDLRPGTHTVRLAGWSSSHVAVAELLVGTAPGAVVASGGGVPTWLWWVGGALGLAGAGFGGVRVVRAMRAAPVSAVEVAA
jgi:hypothetical protein